MAEGGGNRWIGIVVFIGAIVLLNVLARVFEWNVTFF
jgi:hypothetical protein